MVELIDFDRMKRLLELEEDTIEKYPLITDMMEDIKSALEDYLGRWLDQNAAESETIYAGSSLKQMIYLHRTPVNSVTSVTVTVSGIDQTYTENNDFEIEDYGIRLLVPIKKCKVTVVYDGGLTDTTSRFRRATSRQLAYEWQTKNNMGATTVNNEGGSTTTPELGLLKEVRRMLEAEIHPLKQ